MSRRVSLNARATALTSSVHAAKNNNKRKYYFRYKTFFEVL